MENVFLFFIYLFSGNSTPLSENQSPGISFLIFLILLLGSICVLLIIKYLALKNAINNSIKDIRTKHEEEIREFRNQFYVSMNEEFKTPFSQLSREIEQLGKEEKNTEKKKEFDRLTQKIKLICHKLNRWPEKGKVKEDRVILDRLKKEIHLQAEAKYPTKKISSIKNVLINPQEKDDLNLVKNYMENSLSTEIFNVRLSGADEKLLKSIIKYVRANLENTELSVEGMSKKLGLSRNHLHRKLKALTGKSPVEFIKIIRMCYAAHFLTTGKWSVSEVGYKVGYNTPSYFSSSFTSYYGITPTAYMEKFRQTPLEEQ